jgi:branched-chain amino acid transport system permease protein
MEQVLNAAAFSALLVLVVTGLAIIYGLRGVMNFSHGALYMAGSYLGYTVAAQFNFWLSLLVVPVLMALIGIPFELGVLRPLRKLSPTYIALATFGAALVIEQIILQIYGGSSYRNPLPVPLDGSIAVFGTHYPTYRLFVIVVGVVFSLALFLWLRLSRTGIYVRAVSQDPETAQLIGINKDRIGLWIVCLATGCAGLAGVLAGPYVTTYPSMGSTMVVTSLIIVVVGGVGSLGGAIISAVLYGAITIFGAQWAPGFSSVLPYLAAFIILIIAPRGFGRSREA